MSRLLNKIADMKLSRRDFLKGSLVATGAVAGLSLVGCDSSTVVETTTEAPEVSDTTTSEVTTEHSPIVDLEQGGEWKAAACWHNCGGRCLNKVYMKDGIVIRQKTDDTHEDSPLFPQQRGCVRGRSQQQQCFGADRLKYPMKRKNWSVDEPNGHLRGIDEWERITWEEAFDLVAAGLKKAYDEHGANSVIAPSWYSPEIFKILNRLGGFTQVVCTGSWGAFSSYKTPYLVGLYGSVTGSAVDRLTLMKCDTIVLYGCNPAWSSAGNPAYNFSQGKKKNMEYIFVGPEYNVTASMLNAKWIRVRPGTDTAFLLAVAYEMLMLDEKEGNIIDWDFMNRCVSGFDDDHMPEGAKSTENLKGYLLGNYDGIPKTAEWASEICGTPVEDIRWYAAKMGKENKVALLHSFAPARCHNAEEFPPMFYAIGALGGHMGREGHACGTTYNQDSGDAGDKLVNFSGKSGLPPVPANPVTDTIYSTELWQAILDKKYIFRGSSSMMAPMGVEHVPAEERDIDIRVIYNENGTFLQTVPGQAVGIQAHRAVDMVVTQHSFYSTTAKYSDIVLPVTTLWERVNAYDCSRTANRESIFIPSKIVEPLYEAKSDQEIATGIAKSLNIDPAELYPFDETQQWFNMLVDCTTIYPDGSYGKLITITEEDIKEWGVTGTPQEGVIALKELLEKGCYQVPRSEDDNYHFIGYKDYREDPEKYPMPSETGKFQLYSDKKAEIINYSKRNNFEAKPYPTYHPALFGYEASFSDWENKVKGDYPYQITNPHYLRRAHSALDNIPWLRETMKNPVWINASDAAEKGVSEGDTVLIYSPYGKVLRNATLTERMMPGVMALPHGAWVDIDEETGIDRAGSDNMLLAQKASGIGISGYNTCLVNFEKYDGPALEEDWTWPQRIIEF